MQYMIRRGLWGLSHTHTYIYIYTYYIYTRTHTYILTYLRRFRIYLLLTYLLTYSSTASVRLQTPIFTCMYRRRDASGHTHGLNNKHHLRGANISSTLISRTLNPKNLNPMGGLTVGMSSLAAGLAIGTSPSFCTWKVQAFRVRSQILLLFSAF